MHRQLVGTLLAIAAISLLPRPSDGIPLFARRYNIPCSSCHTGDFKLNDFGGAFDVNGF